MATKKIPTDYGFKITHLCTILLTVMILGGVLLGPVTPNLKMAQRSATMQTARTIGLCLYQYAADHNGRYPEGKTSSEVFQHLLDEKYVSDPQIFYTHVVIPEKVRPENDRLKPENVSWDVTCCVDQSAPDGLPVVFLTGYKITYQAGARAMPLNSASSPPRTWYQWAFGPSRESNAFIAVCYKDNSSKAIRADDDGSIPNFIPADFDPKGKTYRQLTP